jgi:hypothetical protein
MRHHPATVLGSALLLVLLSGGCKKDESKPDTVKDTSAAQDTSTAAPAPTPAPTASASTSPDGGPDTATPSSATTAVHGYSIDGCCSALQAQAKTAAATQKARAKQAAQLCSSIAGLVKDGRTSHAAALTQLRSAAGGSLPGACH